MGDAQQPQQTEPEPWADLSWRESEAGVGAVLDPPQAGCAVQD